MDDGDEEQRKPNCIWNKERTFYAYAEKDRKALDTSDTPPG